MNMRSTLVLFIALSACTAEAANAAGSTDTANGSATTVIIAPISIAHDTGAALNFGTILQTSGGSVTLDQAGVVTYGVLGGGDAALFGGSKTSVDSFTISGDPNHAVALSIPSSITLNGPTGTTPMSVTRIAGPPLGVTLSASGTYTFKIGGTLGIPNGQKPGTYTGQYTVTASYP